MPVTDNDVRITIIAVVFVDTVGVRVETSSNEGLGWARSRESILYGESRYFSGQGATTPNRWPIEATAPWPT